MVSSRSEGTEAVPRGCFFCNKTDEVEVVSMARAPDKRIEQAKAMYLQGQKLVAGGSVRINGIMNARIKKRTFANAAHSLEIKILQAVRQETGKLKNMDSFPNIFRMKPGRFFLLLTRQILWSFSGIRYRLPMRPSSGHRGLPM